MTLPRRFSGFLCNDRYTNAGDTVVTLSAERHNVVDVALQRSRRVEVFVSNVASESEVRNGMKTSFSRAYKDGKWKVNTICPLLFLTSVSFGYQQWWLQNWSFLCPRAHGIGRGATVMVIPLVHACMVSVVRFEYRPSPYPHVLPAKDGER